MPERERSGPRERRIWRSVGTLAGAAVVLFGAAQTWTSLVRQGAVHPQTFPNVTALELDLQDASTTIRATPGGPERGGAVSLRQSEHWTVSRPQITVMTINHTLRISARCPQVLGITEPSCSVGLDIDAPPSTAVTVKSTSGDTTIHDLSGSLNLHTNSGSIELDGVSGRVNAQLSSGSLTGQRLASSAVQAVTTSGSVDLQFAAAPRTLALTCTSGSLNAGLPPGSQYRVNVFGPADVDPQLNDPGAANSITASCGSGYTNLGFAAG
ncbi:DUF4097 family beta strand repeat-containing protein [Kitasatospora sp. LaBMicrA B282]|uniref:DUF4097 family beta strand repeat-containing protein n=1 Tax=Kitasatospora sp. LaBMicrA B282 TaxID=3420949 RepID=UPI003D11D519